MNVETFIERKEKLSYRLSSLKVKVQRITKSAAPTQTMKEVAAELELMGIHEESQAVAQSLGKDPTIQEA